MNIDFDKNWTFKEVVENIEVLKSQTWDILTSFSCFEQKQKISFQKELRNSIYSLQIESWKKERILECIYGDFDICQLKKFI